MTNQIPELVDESLDILKGLGEPFDKVPQKSHVKRRKQNLLKRLSMLSDNEILSLDKLDNHNSQFVLELISNVLAQVQYFSSHFLLNRMLLFRGLELTLDEGLCKWSPPIFAFAAFAVFDENDKEAFDASLRLSDLAIRLAKEWKGKKWRTMLAADALTFRHWRQPYTVDVDDAYKMYEEDLKRGQLVLC